jgi:outer membrane beta-barrel protein
MRWTLLLLLVSLSAAAQDKTLPEADFDSLGGNTILLERAKALEPEKNISIVQARTVSRRHRVEIAPELSSTFGGDSYARTKSLGINLNYHFTPRISVGLKYNYSFNSLTREGEAMVDRAYDDFQADPENPSSPYPEIDYVKDEALALVNWYPIYGKINLFEKSVVHFDVYALGGGGQVRLRSGATSTYTAGGGIGFWISQHFSTRLEMRYQNYTAKYLDGEKPLDLTVGSLQMGWLL